MSLESVIITNIVRNEPFFRKISPFIKLEYFESKEIKIIIKQTLDYFYEYNELPNSVALKVLIDKNKKIDGNLFKKIDESINVIYSDDEITNNSLNQNIDWLVKQTEEFFKQKSVYNAFLKAVDIIDKQGTKESTALSILPSLFLDALKVQFDHTIGHNYFDDAEARFQSYKDIEEKICTGIKILDDCTNGGFETKTLQVWLGGTGTGKTLVFCNHAANALSYGQDVVYFTMEMSEKKIAQRIDANLLDVNINDLPYTEVETLNNKINDLHQKTRGHLIIKEYPTGMPNVNTFRNFLDELWQKKKIRPKVVIFDYINLCSSVKVKNGINSYEKIKYIAEEIRGLAVEYEFCGITGTQSNRDAQGASDMDLTNTSESFALPATADFMGAIIYNEELKQKGQMMMKILKTRYADNVGKAFTVGRDNNHMRLFDLEYQNGEHLPQEKIQKMVAQAPKTINNFNFSE